MPIICRKCGEAFPFRVKIDGKIRNLQARKYCLTCSPFGERKIPGQTWSQNPPEPLPPSEELAYLTGVIAGDGCIFRQPSGYKLQISCDTFYPSLIERYAALVQNVLGGNVKLNKRTGENCVDIYLYRQGLPELLGLPSGAKKTNGFTIPEWIYESTNYLQLCLLGLLETDGGVYHIYKKGGWFWYCGFTSHYDLIMSGFLRGMTQLGYIFVLNNHKAVLSRSAEVKRLIAELGINKIREYVYN